MWKKSSSVDWNIYIANGNEISLAYRKMNEI